MILLAVTQTLPALDGGSVSAVVVMVAMILLVYLNIRARRLFDKAIEKFDAVHMAERDAYTELEQEYNELVRKHNGLIDHIDVQNKNHGEILALSIRILAENSTGPLQEQLRSMIDQIERVIERKTVEEKTDEQVQ
jgi:uncharacterized protein YoxC